MRRGRVDEAIAHYEEALRLSPEYESAHNNLGNVLLAHGRVNEAIAHFQKALENRPEHETTYNNLGSALAGRGQVNEAIALFPEGGGPQAELRLRAQHLGLACQPGPDRRGHPPFPGGSRTQPANAAITAESRPGVDATGGKHPGGL